MISTQQDTSYYGWKNYETWNVALWIGNDESLYNDARAFHRLGYKEWVRHMRAMFGDGTFVATPDGVNWNDSKLDIEALNELLGDL